MVSKKAVKELELNKKRIDQIEKILSNMNGWKTIDYTIHYAGKRKGIHITLSNGNDIIE